VVEYNPRQDVGGVTAVVAAKIVKEIAGRILAENSHGDRPGDRRPG
jgi:arginase family enzyme